MIIDLPDCPDEAINAHLADSGIEYAMYHRAAFQIFICEECTLQAAIDRADSFLSAHIEAITALRFDDSFGEAECGRPSMVIELWKDSVTDVVLPKRLIENLDRVAISLSFDRL